MLTLRSARPTARKAHRCDLCGSRIEPGETYDRQTNIYDGHLYDWLTCQPCLPVFGAVITWLDGYWDDEGVGVDQADEWARECTDDPLAVAYLARREAANAEWLARVASSDEREADRG